VVIDPVNGTLNYSRGSSDYAVMGAWLADGACRSAVVHFPSSGKIFSASQGRGCQGEREGTGLKEAGIGSLPSRVLVTPRVPEDRRHALRASGFEVEVSRCSAVDATAPLLGRACAALSLGRPDRRRSVGFLLTREAGGAVWTGDRWWTGEDPRRMEDFPGVTLVSGDRETAERLLRVLS
jgi:fructose-1,6-bisphosphatase/inositol monophosphatase family enzyme